MKIGSKLGAVYVAFILIWGLNPPHGLAQQVIDQVQYSVPFERQDTMVWCWVASAKMVVESLGVQTPSQCGMLQRVYQAPCCTAPAYCAKGGYIPEVQSLISFFGLKPTQVTTWGDGFSFFKTLKGTGAPLVVYVDGDHFVVATGMRIVQTPAGPYGIVNINDPFRGIGQQGWSQLSPRIGAVIATQR